LYIPLGGSKRGPTHTQMNLMITMLLGGLWHGAGWNWVIWGGLQGVMMVIERVIGLSENPPKKLAARILRWFITFHLVCLSWVFFRAADVEQAWVILSRIGTFSNGSTYDIWYPIGLVVLLILVELTRVRKRFVYLLQHTPRLALWVAIVAFIFFALAFRGASSPEFIYFQF
ncbi:unnamed protein product, partial [Laminaria digitata]